MFLEDYLKAFANSDESLYLVEKIMDSERERDSAENRIIFLSELLKEKCNIDYEKLKECIEKYGRSN